jgi:hypothetical protein
VGNTATFTDELFLANQAAMASRWFSPKLDG